MTKTTQEIKVYKDLMGANEEWAEQTRRLRDEKGVEVINLIGSPGSGKTRLIERTVHALKGRVNFAVLEGDVETTNDAERLRATDVPVSQLLTGGACHLEAKLVHHALQDLPLDELDVVFVENVGNLVCPAEFDVGETAKVAALSITEGEDKPQKYPLLFREAESLIITKCDLLQHLDFNLEQCVEHAKAINPSLQIFETAVSPQEDKLAGWPEWLLQRCACSATIGTTRSERTAFSA